MIPAATIEKKKTNNFIENTFLSIMASGRDKPAMAIIKAKAVPKGIPLTVKAKAMGTTVEQPA